jgi:hypothetical protein
VKRQPLTSRPKLLLALFISALAAFALAAGNRARLAAAEQQPQGDTESEIITIRSTGFEPSEISRPKGEFYLAVENLSGLDEVNLRLARENGAGRLHDVTVKREKRDWRQGLDLPPGTYLLTEANHPNWVCRVTITSR